MFTIQFFEQETQCLNPQPPVRPVPDELLRNIMIDDYLKEEGKA
jgi:hypothetical protein